MLNTLKNHLTKNNTNLVKELVHVIKINKISSIEELIDFENKQFTINGKLLNKQERIAYASKISLESYWDYDGLDLDEINAIDDLKQSLKSNISDEDKIYNLIKLFDITGNECLFVSEAYNLVISDKYK